MRNAFLALAVLAFTALPAAAQSTVLCESLDGKYRECRLDGVGIATLARQVSDNACIEGQTWGYRDGRIWVDRGCRAQFTLTSRLATGPLDSSITCESLDGRISRCIAETGGGVRLLRRISDSGCVFGTDWGYDVNGIWVNNGCRAEFAVTSTRLATHTTMGGNSFLCESIDGRRAHCRAETDRGAILTRQLSDTACRYGRTWGIDESGVWVDSGCRGEFALGTATLVGTGMISSAPAAAPTLLCESLDGQHRHCRADTRFGVSMIRQISDAKCERDRTWGVDDVGVWVTNGCRAEFVLDRR